MKKVSTFLLATLFSLGVIAQTTPATTPTAVDNKMHPVKPATSHLTTANDNTPANTNTPTSKNNLKKSATHKKATHHVTPVKKANSAVGTQETPIENLKK